MPSFFFVFWFLASHNYKHFISFHLHLVWWYGKMNLNFEIQCPLNSHCTHEHWTKTNTLRNLTLFYSISKCALNNRSIQAAIKCFGGQMCQNVQKLLGKMLIFLAKIENVAQTLSSRICLREASHIDFPHKKRHMYVRGWGGWRLWRFSGKPCGKNR